jgi:hypothetical protein
MRGRISVSELEDGVHIAITTTRRHLWNYFSSSVEACLAGELLTLVLSPIIFPVYFIAQLLFASNRPRAELVWTNETFDLQLTSDTGGGWNLEQFKFPSGKVVCFRRNQFARAVYFRVTGVIDTDLLGDLDDGTFEVFVEEIEKIPSRLAALRTPAPSPK